VRLTLKPDALTVIHLDAYEDRYFIEADCGTEPGTRIRAKAREYIRYWRSGREDAHGGVFPYVLWVAPSPKRAAFLVEALVGLPAEDWALFLVATDEEAVRRISTGAGVPIGSQWKEVNQ
jgi:hypothetical protein